MPRAVSAYKTHLNEPEHIDPISKINLAIIVAIIVFLGHSFFDAYSTIQMNQPALEQQSKICIGEFNAKLCDPFKTTKECSELMDCIQRGNSFGAVSLLAAASNVLGEMQEGLPYVSSIVILMIVFQLRNMLTNNGRHRDE